MHKKILILLSVAMLTGCPDKKGANESNFGAAIDQYLQKKGKLCLNVLEWPVDISEGNLFQGNAKKEMAALETAGLVSGTDTEMKQPAPFNLGNPIIVKVRSYTVTDTGKKHYEDKDKKVTRVGSKGVETRMLGGFCYGQVALEKVLKWEGPAQVGVHQVAEVKYLYKIENLADWANKPEIQAVFPIIKNGIEGMEKTEMKIALKLTSEGWEAGEELISLEEKGVYDEAVKNLMNQIR